MGVHDVAEYVKYHQAKLREQEAQSNPAPAVTSAPRRRGGVNQVHSKAEFDKYMSDNPDKLVVVDFFATWCGPCKVIAPELVDHSNDEKFSGKTLFLKVDVDNVPDVAQEYSVRAMPTIMYFKKGQVVKEVVGANRMAIRKAIEEHL